jgi:putative transposase
MVCYLKQLKVCCALPKTSVIDNSSEMTSKAMFYCSQETKVNFYLIQPDNPIHNVLVESFYGRFRNGCLDPHKFRDFADIMQIIDDWRGNYNDIRPHSPLGYKHAPYTKLSWLDMIKSYILN